MQHSPPPSLPIEAIYTKYYCEENIYLQAQDFCRDPTITEFWDLYVVFISNTSKTVMLWSQKSSKNGESPVIWDYHVVLILRPRPPTPPAVAEDFELEGNLSSTLARNDATALFFTTYSWVYDFDTRLPVPCPLPEYLKNTFPVDLDEEFRSLFRVLTAHTYLEHFASDRSHMLIKDRPDPTVDVTSTYTSPPPSYPVLQGVKAKELGVTNNLMDAFVTMTPVLSYGRILTLEQFRMLDF